MRPDQITDICVLRAMAIKPGADGVLDDAQLAKEKRAKKAGMLPAKARMVLAAARHCLPLSFSATSDLVGDVGVSLGTLYGSMDVAELCLNTAHDEGFAHVVPSWYTTGLPNATTAIVASVYNLGGPNLTFVGHQAGLDAIIHGCRQIAAGRAASMLAGGFDMPSAYFGQQLRASEQYRASASVHPGTGLLLLSRHTSDDDGAQELARIVGWSQQFHADEVLSNAQIALLVDAASARKQISVKPKVHLVYPGADSTVDHLAASAPIYLIDTILAQEAAGLHALIGKGYGASVSCLLIQKN
ncbi:beta-ketoacyl synthase N-terminal-like domain-containing protein [Paraherbaspirillum soli]|uniref:Beta-ketoacyl synthase N-terminal-like domain-containing protein n=1 Tax=Paraherbaspirillum soli TaxID=631222 RepID=A0ABW0M5R5_9BURK